MRNFCGAGPPKISYFCRRVTVSQIVKMTFEYSEWFPKESQGKKKLGLVASCVNESYPLPTLNSKPELFLPW